MENLEELELIRLAQNGDQEALNTLLYKNKGWVDSQTIYFNRKYPQVDPSSINSFVYESLWEAIIWKNADQKISIRYFTQQFTQRKIITRIRYLHRPKRWQPNIKSTNFENISSDSVRFITQEPKRIRIRDRSKEKLIPKEFEALKSEIHGG